MPVTPQAQSTTLRHAILLDPKNANLYLDFAHISYVHQSFRWASVSSVRASSSLPSAAPLYLARGVLYVQLADYDKAEADFEKAHEVDPNQSLSVAAQGMAAVQANDSDRALGHRASRSWRARQMMRYLLYLQADILSQQGRRTGRTGVSNGHALGKESGVAAAQLSPTRVVCWRSCICWRGRTRRPIEQCRKALEINPKDQTALVSPDPGAAEDGEQQGDPRPAEAPCRRFANRLRGKSGNAAATN